MDIDDLRIVTTVAKCGSMNRAAAELHMVQSAVTSRIRLIEEELGVRLFMRHSRGVRLSDAGTRLLSYSDRIYTLFNEAITAVKEDGVPKGSLKIGSTEPTVSMRLPHIVSDYARNFPAVALTIITGNSAELIKQVISNTLDAAFVAAPVQHPELSCETIFEEKLVLATHTSIRTMDDLTATPDLKAIVLDHGCSYRDRLCDILDARAIAYKVLSVSSFDAIRSCVEAGIGVTVLTAEFFANAWHNRPVISHQIPEFDDPFETLFICRSDNEQLSSLHAFLERSRASSNVATRRLKV